MPVSDIARESVVTVDPDTAVGRAVERMDEEDVGSVVVTEGETPVGILTDRSVALALADDRDVPERPVREVMSTGLTTVAPDDGVAETTYRLREAGVRRAPVVDESESLVGIVTMDDLAVLLIEELADLKATIESQSPRF